MVGGFDRVGLAEAVAARGAVVRVVVAGFRGSTPRETGAAMLVWADAMQAGGQPVADGIVQEGSRQQVVP